MARQRVNPPAQPSLPPDKSIPILENLILTAEELRQELPNSPQRETWVHTGEGALIAALGEGHPTIDAFAVAQTGAYGQRDTQQYRMRQANSQLDSMIAALRAAVEQLRWRLPDRSQIFLPAGSPHDAFVEIRKIMMQVANEVLIVDTYVDDTLWALLTNVTSPAKIRILTMTMKGDFALEGRKFAKQHGNKVEARTNSTIHDRFIFVDDARCWHLGASIKDAGAKACVISEFSAPTITGFIKQEIEAAWNASMHVHIL